MGPVEYVIDPSSGRPSATEAGELLERERELAAIEALLFEAARESQGMTMLLEGPAGIGKTSLLRRARRAAEHLGMRILYSQTGELERDLAWGAVLQLFGDFATDEIADQGPAILTRPLLMQGASAGTERLPLLHGLHWLLNRASEERPLLLLLDDIHHCDPESLAFIAYLQGRLEHLPVAIILAARSGEPLSPETGTALAQIRSHRQTRILEPRGLSPDAVRRLAQAKNPTGSEDLLHSVVAKVGGNPFLCIALATWQRAGDLGSADRREAAPLSIQRELRARLEGYGHAPNLAAQALAVLSHGDLSQVAGLAGLTPQETSEALDLLAGVGLLDSAPDFRFTHPIVQEAVYDMLGPGRRQQMHRGAAAILRDLARPAREVAAHLMLGDPIDESWQIETLAEAAAADVALGAPSRAVARYRRILATALDPPSRARFLFELGRAEIAAGGDQGLTHLRAAVGLLPPSRTDADLILKVGESIYASGRFEEAAAVFNQGLELLDGPSEREPRTEARLLAGLGIASLLSGRPEERAMAAAERAADGGGKADSIADRTLMALAAGEFALGGRRERESVIALAEGALATGSPSDLGRTVLEPLAAALTYCDRFGTARRLLDEVIGEASRSGEAVAYASLLAIRSNCHLCAGEIIDAEADARACLQLFAEFPAASAQAVPIARYVLARSCLAAGRLDDAVEAVEPRETTVSAENPLDGWLLTARGQVRLSQGQAQRALDDFEQAGSLLAPFADAGVACDWRSGSALALRALDRGSEARARAATELELAERFGGRRVIGLALRRCAKVAASGIEAIETLERSAEMLENSGALLDLATTEVELGASRRRNGERKLARETLRQGLALAREIEAGALVARASDELALAGARRPDLELHGVRSLTPGQRRVARMAAEGRSNAEIAATLFVTKRTVETHLTAVYTKLGIASRQELPAAELRSAAESAQL